MGALVMSGNEVTDLARRIGYSLGTSAAGQMLDGRALPGGVGIYRAATNLFRRGQCDALGVGGASDSSWSTTGGGTTTRAPDATTAPPFSTQSIKYTTDGTAANQGCHAFSATGLAAAAGTIGVGSVWFKGVAGQSYQAAIRWSNTDASTTEGASTTFTATGAWQLITPAGLAVAALLTGDRVGIRVWVNGTRAESFWVAHAMLESGQSVVAPYVATSGGSTATHADPRLRAPATLLGSGKWWFAARLRFGYSDADIANFAFNPRAFTWEDDATHRFTFVYNRSGAKTFSLLATNGGSNVSAQTTALSSVSAGDIVTVIGAADPVAKTISSSLNGAAFTTTSIGSDFPTIAASAFDIATEIALNAWSGDVLWFACGAAGLTGTDAAAIAALWDLTTQPNRRLMPWDFPPSSLCQMTYDPRDNGSDFFYGAPGVPLLGGIR